jgi:predicted nucleotidyltransferase
MRFRGVPTQLVAVTAAVYGLCMLGYFGSYARNKAAPASDVDIVFDTDAPNLFLTAMLKQDLEELLGRPVDVLAVKRFGQLPAEGAHRKGGGVCITLLAV